MTSRVSRGAWSLLKYLRAVHALNGWLKISLRFLRQKYGRSKRTILRWSAELKAAGILTSERHGQECRRYVLAPQDGTSEQPVSLLTEPLEITVPTEQNHSADVAGENLEPIRKAAGLERLSEGDRRFTRELERKGIEAAVIRAGVAVGRARNLVSKVPSAIRSLRYFLGPIIEASQGAFPAGYADHCERRVEYILQTRRCA